MDPGPGVRLGASAGGVISIVCRCDRDGAIWLYLANGLRVNEFRLCLIIKCFHYCSSLMLNNADIDSKSRDSVFLSMQ